MNSQNSRESPKATCDHRLLTVSYQKVGLPEAIFDRTGEKSPF